MTIPCPGINGTKHGRLSREKESESRIQSRRVRSCEESVWTRPGRRQGHSRMHHEASSPKLRRRCPNPILWRQARSILWKRLECGGVQPLGGRSGRAPVPSVTSRRRKQLNNSYHLDEASNIARSEYLGRPKIRPFTLTSSPSQYLRRHLCFPVPA
jgi:hypothetical protein